ncbi:hypothetical protein [Microbispora sp. NPDC046933]|uniref:hypothetical protein n=1 Tax=Microbispora sp. NPDC046933 TaxID=3155618 RepID=UPI0033C8925C
MNGKGINFDTGFADAAARAAGRSTRDPFDLDVVEREMRVIREDLHCTGRTPMRTSTWPVAAW